MSCGLSRHDHAQAHLLHSGSDAGVPRGMACIAAFLLAVLGPGREEDAFWTFAGLLENRVPASCVLEVSPPPTAHLSDTRLMRPGCRPEDAFWRSAGLLQISVLTSCVHRGNAWVRHVSHHPHA